MREYLESLGLFLAVCIAHFFLSFFARIAANDGKVTIDATQFGELWFEYWLFVGVTAFIVIAFASYNHRRRLSKQA